jgi:hypothetical protein
MKELRSQLKQLASRHAVSGLKGGTEVEAMNFDELAVMREVTKGIMPMTVKIGGAEARNDIQEMVSLGVDKLLGPMIESPYAMKNFVEATQSIDSRGTCKLAVNIETITSYTNLHAILETPWARFVEQVTVGRSDLAGSMGLTVDDEKVMKTTVSIVELAREQGMKTSVGGQINPRNGYVIQQKIGPDMINTRNSILDATSTTISEDIEAALEFEKLFYQYLDKLNPARSKWYAARILSCESRIAEKLVLN